VVAVSIRGHVSEHDRRGVVVRSFNLPHGHWCGIEALPSDHYLAAELNTGLVVETDAAGKVVWQCKVAGAVHALRRPNGRTLICSYTAAAWSRLIVAGSPSGRRRAALRPGAPAIGEAASSKPPVLGAFTRDCLQKASGVRKACKDFVFPLKSEMTLKKGF
jgi:hypothetical protein